MISEVVMPQMGADMIEGTIVKWLKHDGDAVTRGEIIAEIETDKANVEIEAFEGGTFRATLAAEGDTIPVGGVIAIIAAPEDDISKYTSGGSPSPNRAEASPPTADAPAATPPVTPATPSPAPAIPTARSSGPPPAPEPPASSATRIRISPVARNLAHERNVNIAGIHGSGPDGRIIRSDVEAAIAGTPPAQQPAPATSDQRSATARPSKMRQAIARRMSQSKREAPHYYLLADIDMTDALEFRRQLNTTLAEGEHVSINDLIVRASALALQRHREFNATLADDRTTVHDAQNVCIAIAMEEGLIAPAILDAGAKTLVQIAADARDLANRAKTGALRPREITDGTFTVTNLGAYGIETLIGIIQPPQTAILGVGTVSSQPTVRDDAVVIRQRLKVALSADHRTTDGAQGAQFLSEIKRLLEQPLLLVL